MLSVSLTRKVSLFQDEALRRGRQRLGSSLSEGTRAALAAVVEQLGGPGEQESAAAEATPHYLIL